MNTSSTNEQLINGMLGHHHNTALFKTGKRQNYGATTLQPSNYHSNHRGTTDENAYITSHNNNNNR